MIPGETSVRFTVINVGSKPIEHPILQRDLREWLSIRIGDGEIDLGDGRVMFYDRHYSYADSLLNKHATAIVQDRDSRAIVIFGDAAIVRRADLS